MFDPQLDENREEFGRITRLRFRAFVIMVACCTMLAFAVPFLLPDLSSTVEAVLVTTPLWCFAVYLGYTEIRKTRIFMKDVRQRRKGSATDAV